MNSAKVSRLVTSRPVSKRASVSQSRSNKQGHANSPVNLELFSPAKKAEGSATQAAAQTKPVLSLIKGLPINTPAGFSVHDFQRLAASSLSVKPSVNQKQLRPSVFSVAAHILKVSAGPTLAIIAVAFLAVRFRQAIVNPPEAFAAEEFPTTVVSSFEKNAEVVPSVTSVSAADTVSTMDTMVGTATQLSVAPLLNTTDTFNQISFIAGMISANQPTMANVGMLAKEIVETSNEESFDPFFVAAVISVESRFTTHARSSVGALGLMQLRPSTAKEVSTATTGNKSYPLLTHAETNIRLGINYLKQMEKKYKGNTYLSLAAYNWGPAKVDRALKHKRRFPESVEAYASKIIERSKLWSRHFKSIQSNA